MKKMYYTEITSEGKEQPIFQINGRNYLGRTAIQQGKSYASSRFKYINGIEKQRESLVESF